jgi:2',3'-cyclic-nucleotide 2'-phosphodiesterase (5'-nucleotidase family)
MPRRLRIVAVNDVYSLENLPRLRSLVLHHQEHDPADLLLITMAGDFLAPSVLSSLDHGAGMVDCLNHLPITHAILGNHEDDLEPQHLRARLHELNATVLLSNVHGFDETFPKFHVLEVGDVKIGLIGVVDNDPPLYRRPPFGAETAVEPPNLAARREQERLIGLGCAWVIALTHQRVSADRALATTTPAFPLIIGGHEHDGLLERIGETLLIKAPMDAASAAVINITCTTPPTISAELEAVSKYPEDTAMRARVDSHLAAVQEIESATLMILPPGQVLSSVGTRMKQTSMGSLLCSRLRDAFGAEGCLFNGGGIRGSCEYSGRLTYGDLKTEVPFDNEIVVARLPGSVIRDAVAASRAMAPKESGGFFQVDDRMKVDEHNQVIEIDRSPLDPARLYRIALVRNLFAGMDHNAPLVQFAKEHPAEVPTESSGREVKVVLLSAFSSMLVEQLGGFDVIDSDRDGRITSQELLDAIARATSQPASALSARVVFDALDSNHDHSLTRDEVPKK